MFQVLLSVNHTELDGQHYTHMYISFGYIPSVFPLYPSPLMHQHSKLSNYYPRLCLGRFRKDDPKWQEDARGGK